MTTGQGYMRPENMVDPFNRADFHISQRLSRVRTIVPVKVITSTGTGAIAAPGFVDVQPLVNMVDGIGSNATEHTTVFHVPVLRVGNSQGDLIADPLPGDLGVVFVCDRDISAVKSALGPASPGSRRRFDLADSIYLGRILTGVPTQYLQFSDTGAVLKDKFGNQIAMANGIIIISDAAGNLISLSSGGLNFEQTTPVVASMFVGPSGAQLTYGTASVLLQAATVTVTASAQINLNAPVVAVNGTPLIVP